MLTIAPMTAADWPAVCAIFEQGMETGNATLETRAPDWETWNPSHMREGRLAGRIDDRIVGWAALTPVSSRCVYAGVAEVSIYIAESARGQGAGKALLNSLVAESERMGIWTLQAGILRENEASIALHTACGFRVVGIRERIGQRDGIWRDVILMERRSAVVGA
ncbi:MAG: N-acetyltransferase family protein [Anaerolineae bacterium]